MRALIENSDQLMLGRITTEISVVPMEHLPAHYLSCWYTCMRSEPLRHSGNQDGHSFIFLQAGNTCCQCSHRKSDQLRWEENTTEISVLPMEQLPVHLKHVGIPVCAVSHCATQVTKMATQLFFDRKYLFLRG